MKTKKIDIFIILPIIVLAIISITSIYSAQTYLPAYLGNLALKQLLWYIIGIIIVLIIMYLKNDFFYKHINILYIIGNILLLGLLFFGQDINGSKCWYIIPGIGSFQPSEFMKIILIIIIGLNIEKYNDNKNYKTFSDEFFFLLKILIIVLIPSIITFLEPDTGAVIIYFIIMVAMLFVSKIRTRWFVISAIILLILGGSFLGLYFFKEKLFIKIFGTNFFYRLDRIFAWTNKTGMQLENALASIGSAGLLGHGFNKTPLYFPEPGTDFIFAVFASNFGLLLSILFVLLILFFDLKLLTLSIKHKNTINSYILIGILGMLSFQQIQNISMTIGLLPITGITLPFISYGGSSLLSYMIILGIIMNIQLGKR